MAKNQSAAKESFPFSKCMERYGTEVKNPNNMIKVISSGPKAPKDGAMRTLIRKQAMKDVGLARRRRGNSRRVNTRQPVIFDEDTDIPIESAVSSSAAESSEGTSETPSSSSDHVHPLTEDTSSTGSNQDLGKDLAIWHPHGSDFLEDDLQLVPSLSLNVSYDRTRAKFCIDISQLGVLTNWSINRTAIPVISADPQRLLTLLDEGCWSFLQHLPQMYDSNKYIATATDAVLAKASEVLSPYPTSPGLGMKLYAKALTTLQEGISNSTDSTSAEVLAATQLMALHELLDTSGAAAWRSHIHGSQRLVRHRSPSRFRSEFDKAIFAAHIGPVVSETLIEGEPCYLDDPEWLDLYRSIILETESLTDRSELVVNSRCLEIELPGQWYDVAKAVQGEDLFNDDVLAELEVRLRKSQKEYLAWLDEYKSYCMISSFRVPSPSEMALRRQIFGEVIECLLIVKRLLSVVCDSARLDLETEVQGLACLIIDLQQQPSVRHSWLLVGHEVGVAHTAIVSKDLFEEDLSCEDWETQRLGSRRRYTVWSNSLRIGDPLPKPKRSIDY